MSDVRTASDLSDLTREDYIDSRDLVELAENLAEELAEAREADDPETIVNVETFLAVVVGIIEDVDNNAEDDAADGVTIIAADEFERYAQELAEDIGAVKPGADWPLCHIDWEAAAEALLIDYAEIVIGTRDYYLR